MKNFLRRPAVVNLLSHLIVIYMWLVFLTSRKRIQVAPESAVYLSDEQQSITCLWHGRLLMMPLLRTRRRSFDMLSSTHSDGVLIAKAVAHLGIGAVPGSSSRGGVSGVRGMLRRMKDGGNVGITPDGPRGPARVAARGVAQLSLTSGIPVIPMAFSARHYRRIASWDRFFLPLPFTTLFHIVGAPLRPEAFTDSEVMRQTVEAALNAVTDEVDRLAGVPLEDSTPSG